MITLDTGAILEQECWFCKTMRDVAFKLDGVLHDAFGEVGKYCGYMVFGPVGEAMSVFHPGRVHAAVRALEAEQASTGFAPTPAEVEAFRQAKAELSGAKT